MVRLAVSVEGLTEEIFITKVMAPHLQRFGIYTQPHQLGGTGGDISFSRVRTDLNNFARSYDFVTTMYDFYGFKGLLFSSPQAIQNVVGEKGLTLWAEDILRQFGGDPEAINDSQQTAPSKRFNAAANFRKTTHGPNIAEEIGLENLKAKCKGFGLWLDQLEALPEKS